MKSCQSKVNLIDFDEKNKAKAIVHLAEVADGTNCEKPNLSPSLFPRSLAAGG